MFDEDLFFPIIQWPKYMRILIFCKYPHYNNRLKIALFLFLNGLNPESCFDLYFTYNKFRNRIDKSRFLALFTFIDHLINSNDPRCSKYYYFDLILRKNYFLNGSPKYSTNLQFNIPPNGVFLPDGRPDITRC